MPNITTINPISSSFINKIYEVLSLILFQAEAAFLGSNFPSRTYLCKTRAMCCIIKRYTISIDKYRIQRKITI